MRWQKVWKEPKLVRVSHILEMTDRILTYLLTFLRGESQIKNVPKSGKKVKKGGISAEDQNVKNPKFGLFDKMGGGRLYFHF